MPASGAGTLQNPSVGLFTHDVERLVTFYKGLGFRETYRTPLEGSPTHVEVKLDGLTLALSSVDAAMSDHHLHPTLGGRPVYFFLWTDDTDAAYARMLSNGASSVRPPQDFRSDLREAWVADPDGNTIALVHRRP